jgi:hypothetical protein
MPRPHADFSLVFSEPELADGFLVLRRAEGTDEHGRANPTVVRTFETHGIIVSATPNDLARVPDQQHQQKTISISTQFRLQGPYPGVQPDVIRWHGDDYVVITLDDFTSFGEGFVNALAQRMDANIPLLNAPR